MSYVFALTTFTSVASPVGGFNVWSGPPRIRVVCQLTAAEQAFVALTYTAST